MDKQELLLKLAALQAIRDQGQPSLVGNPPTVSSLKMKPMEVQPEIQMNDGGMGDVQVESIRNPASEDSVEEIPLTQFNSVEAREAALERLKQRGNQKLNFRGGFLDQNGIHDND